MKILFEFILVLALATKQTKCGRLRASDFVDVVVAHSTLENVKEKWLNEEDIGRVRRRLCRLTQEETQMTVAYNMEVVYGLINNIKILMDGARSSLAQLRRVKSLFRWQRIYRWDSAGSQCGRPLYFTLFILRNVLVTIHQIVRCVNKLQRSLLYYVLVADSPMFSR